MRNVSFGHTLIDNPELLRHSKSLAHCISIPKMNTCARFIKKAATRLRYLSNIIIIPLHKAQGYTYTAEDGSAYQYMGHWSWIYFFNNQCEENGVNMWKWMSSQLLHKDQ